MAAKCNGVIPSSSKHRKQAPASINILAIFTEPSNAAQCSAVISVLSLAWKK
jgi:hypothetical protein